MPLSDIEQQKSGWQMTEAWIQITHPQNEIDTCIVRVKTTFSAALYNYKNEIDTHVHFEAAQRPQPAFDSFNECTTDEGSTCSIATELRALLRQPRSDRSSDPLLWWSTNAKGFPGHTRRLLCTPPSSVDSERTFSVAGSMAEDKRSRLTPANVEVLVFLAINMNKISK
ncbi:hypothetical protein CAPTEDRAFT_189003 [Capitella teleta]|uniref:HAT C-terminal dimerisation domain-containing protein n=1 Tax=Capitella teleta TaxID=283909 RepID=R7UM07_CAPTE|nr:hypothetical protein CAPTEDRAFT_189003 [Capitella teleta]|eukprot:ELU07108.1 hypothetical protein CAPTEDRAFT_189003 [Capitella teleta]